MYYTYNNLQHEILQFRKIWTMNAIAYWKVIPYVLSVLDGSR